MNADTASRATAAAYVRRTYGTGYPRLTWALTTNRPHWTADTDGGSRLDTAICRAIRDARAEEAALRDARNRCIQTTRRRAALCIQEDRALLPEVTAALEDARAEWEADYAPADDAWDEMRAAQRDHDAVAESIAANLDEYHDNERAARYACRAQGMAYTVPHC